MGRLSCLLSETHPRQMSV